MAPSYHRLGQRVELDACCRDHDHCPVKLPPLTTRYGVTSFNFATRCVLTMCNTGAKLMLGPACWGNYWVLRIVDWGPGAGNCRLGDKLVLRAVE